MQSSYKLNVICSAMFLSCIFICSRLYSDVPAQPCPNTGGSEITPLLCPTFNIDDYPACAGRTEEDCWGFEARTPSPRIVLGPLPGHEAIPAFFSICYFEVPCEWSITRICRDGEYTTVKQLYYTNRSCGPGPIITKD